MNESIRGILDKGINARRKYLKDNLSILIESNDLLKNKKPYLFLDTLEWLNKNSWIEKISKQKGIIKEVSINILDDYIYINYLAYSKKINQFDKYKVSLPKIIILDNNFCYFLGLLYGDGLNGARVGVVNKDKEIITWTAKFLKEVFSGNKLKTQVLLYQNTSDLNIDENINWLKSMSDETSIYENKKARGDYVFTIFITNNILRRILEGLYKDLGKLYNKLNFEQRGAFLAGFFDAEGNVNKRDNNLRFSQKIPKKVKEIQTILNIEGYHFRYDGSNIIIAFKKEYKDDLNLFERQILPFLIHSKKSNEAKELINGYLVREEYKPIIRVIQNNSGITHKEIANFIKKVKCHAELNALLSQGLVVREGKPSESFKYTITDKGLKYLEKN